MDKIRIFSFGIDFSCIFVIIVAEMASEINQNNEHSQGPKKRVLFIITQSEIGGAQVFLRTLVNRLDKNKYEMLIAAGPSETTNNQDPRIPEKLRNEADKTQDLNIDYELLDQLESEGFEVRRLKYLQRELRPVSDIRALFEIRSLIENFKPMILFLCSSKAGFLGSLASKFKIPALLERGSLKKVERQNSKLFTASAAGRSMICGQNGRRRFGSSWKK